MALMTQTPLSLPPELSPLLEHLRNAGIRPVLVGGYVRDALLGRTGKDIDIECYGAENLDTLASALKGFGTLNAVGKSFGVLKLKTGSLEIDLSLPRKETKTGTGHRGFSVETFGEIDFETAARRRDFTVNAIGYDPFSEKLLDPFGGMKDLERKRLRCVDPATFVEDPLRLLRAVQFAARFELVPDRRLLALARKMTSAGALDELPGERIFEEMKKLLLKAARPSVGFEVMDAMHITPFFPSLHALKQVPQEPASHPEGDVWTHTRLAVDAMAAERFGDEREKLICMLGILCHDLGKPATTRLFEGKITAPGHEDAGQAAARRLLSRWTGDKKLFEAVLPLVRWHGLPKKLYKTRAPESEILRLAVNVPVERIVRIAKADHFGRAGIENRPFKAGEWLTRKAKELGVLHRPLPPLILGRDLVAAGLSPSSTFSRILNDAYEAQLDGIFTTKETGAKWLKSYLEDLGKS